MRGVACVGHRHTVVTCMYEGCGMCGAQAYCGDVHV